MLPIRGIRGHPDHHIMCSFLLVIYIVNFLGDATEQTLVQTRSKIPSSKMLCQYGAEQVRITNLVQMNFIPFNLITEGGQK
jgi:hypothetical protein